MPASKKTTNDKNGFFILMMNMDENSNRIYPTWGLMIECTVSKNESEKLKSAMAIKTVKRDEKRTTFNANNPLPSITSRWPGKTLITVSCSGIPKNIEGIKDIIRCAGNRAIIKKAS